MTIYFLESSALAKLFVQERGSEQLIALVEPLKPGQKLVSSLSAVEVRSAVRRRERMGDLGTESADALLAGLTTELADMTGLPVTADVIQLARELVDRHPLRALDAIQLATCCSARLASGEENIVIFVASDQRLLAAAREEGFEVLDPSEVP